MTAEALVVDIASQWDPRPADSATGRAFAHDLAVVGLGYVGLPTALTFHEAGLTVLGVDIDVRRLHVIRDLAPDQLDSDRDRLVTALDSPRFELSSDVRRLGRAHHVVICVPTPLDDHLLPDLSALQSACAAVVEAASPGQVIVLTSTSYVGTTRDLLVRPLEERGLVIGVDVFVGFSPERIDPGNATHQHETVPRVFGGVTPACGRRLEVFLGCGTDTVHAVGSVEAAEMTKLFENTFRAVNIALANELADISHGLGLDAMEIIAAASTKPYGFMPFFPGPGAGGHCIPCDPHYLLWQLRAHRLEAPLITEAMSCIVRRPQSVVSRLRETVSSLGRGLAGARVVVVGVTYKPDVEDVRESPALEILAQLAAAGCEVAYIDGLVDVVRLRDGTLLRGIDPAEVDVADIVLLHTRHSGLALDWLAAHPLVIDATYRATDLPLRHVL